MNNSRWDGPLRHFYDSCFKGENKNWSSLKGLCRHIQIQIGSLSFFEFHRHFCTCGCFQLENSCWRYSRDRCNCGNMYRVQRKGDNVLLAHSSIRHFCITAYYLKRWELKNRHLLSILLVSKQKQNKEQDEGLQVSLLMETYPLCHLKCKGFKLGKSGAGRNRLVSRIQFQM